MKANLLCGKTLYLRRDPKERNKFRTLDQQWTGILTGADITISRDDGWELKYNNGRLTSLTTDTGRKLKWISNGAKAMAIHEGVKPLLKVEVRPKEVLFVANLRQHTVTFDKRPQIGVVLGQKVIEGFGESLGSWNWPNGETEKFEFNTTEDATPRLVFTDREKIETLYTWDAATGRLLTEGDWKYEVVGKMNEPSALPAVYRVNSDGKKEGMAVDAPLGIYTKLDGAGAETITYTIHEPGPAYSKVQKIIRKTEQSEKTVYKASFDEIGRLVREIDEDGFTTTYSFGKDGKFLGRTIARPTDKNILEALATKEAALLEAVAKATTEKAKGNALQILGFFYIHKVGDHEKALNLLPQMSNRQQQFNIRTHAIEKNISFNGYQKAAQFTKLLQEYPEENKLLELLIRTYRETEKQFELSMLSIASPNQENRPGRENPHK